MAFRTLESSGCVVSALCLGTMTFGDEADEGVSHAQLDRFVRAGGTFVDTADVYSAGESERIVGRWLLSRLAEVTEARGLTPSEVALAWVTDRPGVTSTILGARTLG